MGFPPSSRHLDGIGRNATTGDAKRFVSQLSQNVARSRRLTKDQSDDVLLARSDHLSILNVVIALLVLVVVFVSLFQAVLSDSLQPIPNPPGL
jgi:hypothetical protein